jgi:hypothetical protein
MPHITLRETIAQPILSHAHDLHLLWLEANLLFQLSKHSLFGCLILHNTTLGKLPGVLSYPPTPKQFFMAVTYNHAHIGPETVRIYHFVILILA